MLWEGGGSTYVFLFLFTDQCSILAEDKDRMHRPFNGRSVISNSIILWS